MTGRAGRTGSELESRPHLIVLGNAVHVWRVDVDAHRDEVARLSVYLREPEHVRAAGFYRERDRERYTIVRALLRIVLSRYTGIAPDRLEIDAEPHEKPMLGQRPGGRRFDFNVSHSGSIALIAVGGDREVGVDVEQLREARFDQIMPRFLSRAEQEMVSSSPPAARRDVFFTLWCRKEAYTKGSGEGLRHPFESFSILGRTGEPLAPVASAGSEPLDATWEIRDLDASPGYAAAIAVRGHGWDLSLLEADESLHRPSGVAALA